MPGLFGIDFGTTNTRIAFFDGRRALVVPVRTRLGTFHQIPSVVGYRDGRPVCFGNDALDAQAKGEVTCLTSLKWMADRGDPIPLDGHLKTPEEVIRDFFGFLRQVVAQAPLIEPELRRAAISVPVMYPYRARETLLRAVQAAGIEIAAVYHEPVAALYRHISEARTPGYAAVFDWGGGTLDVAVVETSAGYARVREIDGLKHGGEDFDRMILHKALADFQAQNPDLGAVAEKLLENPRRGVELRLRAEDAKKRLSRESRASLQYLLVIAGRDLDYGIAQHEFQGWIAPDIVRAVECMRRALRHARVSDGLLNCLLLSGGTSNIPVVRTNIQNTFGPRIVVGSQPGPRDAPESDVANATAIGNAMLGTWGARPVFAREIGVRTADAEGPGDHFHAVFHRGEAVRPGQRVNVPLFVANAASGVARILVCDRLDPDVDHHGRLMRILTVPVDRNEMWVDATFVMSGHLVLSVHATGRVARAGTGQSTCVIPNVAIGFEVPPR
jgi:molecular chaperone DnaK (HSP70)